MSSRKCMVRPDQGPMTPARVVFLRLYDWVETILSLASYLDRDLLKQRCQPPPPVSLVFQSTASAPPDDFELELWRLVERTVNHPDEEEARRKALLWLGAIVQSSVQDSAHVPDGLIPQLLIPQLFHPMHQILMQLPSVAPKLPKEVVDKLQGEVPEWLQGDVFDAQPN